MAVASGAMGMAIVGGIAAVWALVEWIGRRYQRLGTVRARMETARRWLAGLARLAPGTLVYIAILTVTVSEQARLSTRLATVLARQNSTNVNLLFSRPFDVLTASAFWLDNAGWDAVGVLIQFAMVMALLEVSVGTGRWLLTIVAGHVGASVIVGFGLWLGIHHHWIAARVARSTDVGISYGLTAATIVLILGLRGRWRVVLLLAVAARLLSGLVFSASFTDVGHLLSALLGTTAYLAFGRPHLHPLRSLPKRTTTPTPISG